mmetsp:Transcript_21523/g.53194  ORF Transcript_21523/g.53194 Transcript_21523/m.53194 type:complete len:824 (+) Transcript_21523:92-2563(+)
MANVGQPPHEAGNDQVKSSITVLVLGDEGVGKSSLISTFVSRHFSEVVPGIMTRVRLPPDPQNACITTIVDSQGGDVALSSVATTISLPTGGGGGGGDVLSTSERRASSASLSSLRRSVSSNTLNNVGVVEMVDSIILVYDLDRDETFFRLENHWLPLIERCYNGEVPVIVAGTKMDLFLPSSIAGVTDEQVLARSRQQVVSLMQRFRFIRQCIKCSAKNLLRVDDVFLKAQQAVFYPIVPIYNLDVGKLSENCERAFTRIFRMYDRDHDGLLSHSELDRFQHDTFRVYIYERDLAGWKKVVTRNNPDAEVVREGKFTVDGFLSIFDVFICQNRLDVPWTALRKFGYDNDLNLNLPQSILYGLDGADFSWRLSSSARRFLADVFLQFDSDKDGILSLEDMEKIFSVVQTPSLPPWHPNRSADLFRGCFSLPTMPTDSAPAGSEALMEVMASSQSLSASGITIISGATFPTIDVPSTAEGPTVNVPSKPLSFLDWMGLWHVASAVSPAVARAELFRLGHVENYQRKRKNRRLTSRAAIEPNSRNLDMRLPSREVRVLLLGSPGSGKTALLNALRCLEDPLSTSKTPMPMTSSVHVRVKKNLSKGSDIEESIIVHLVITDVPEATAENQALRKRHLAQMLTPGNCDLVMLAFDSTNSASLAYANHLEDEFLIDDIPRMYVATKADQSALEGGDSAGAEGKDTQVSVIERAALHCKDLDLEPPLVTSATSSMLSAEGDQGDRSRCSVLEHLARSCVFETGIEQLRAKPHEEEKRREAAKQRYQKMLWLGVGTGVAAAFVGLLWPTKSKGGRFGWFKSLFTRQSAIV